MKIEDIKENYYFETLTAEHDLSDFDCGDEELNNFLKDDALEQQNANLNVTKLAICDNNIVGYVSILSDSLIIKNIRDENVSSEIKEKLHITNNKRTLPAVKIGRIAIDKKFSGKRLGSHILRNILLNLKNISDDEIGFRFIIVEGYAKAFKFYAVKNQFVNLKKDDDQIKNIDFIAKRDPKKKFYLYFDLENI